MTVTNPFQQSKQTSLPTNLFEQFVAIQELTGQASYQVTPSYVFEVQYNSAANQKFEELRQAKDLIYAYHGSRLDNFYSILHNGLHAHMNKVLSTAECSCYSEGVTEIW